MSVEVMALVWRNGPTKAADRLMLLAIADHSDDEGVAWPGLERLAAKCCVKVDAARATVRRLEAAGWLSTVRGGGGAKGHGVPNRYQLRMTWLRGTEVPPVDGGESADRTPPSAREVPPVDTARTPPCTGGEPSVEPSVEPSLPPSADAPAQDRPLFVVPDPQPETAGPPQTAQTLVARWCDGYRSTSGGQDAAGPLMRRVAGQAKNLAKGCATDADWNAAWHAAFAAGAQGRPDATPFLRHQPERATSARRNVFAEPAMGGPGAEAMARFSAHLASTPRAIGDGR